MLRIDDKSGMGLDELNAQEVAIVLNACLANGHQRLDDAEWPLKRQLEPHGLTIYKGHHHISILMGNKQVLQLIDIADPYLAMHGAPDYLQQERLALGLSLDGTGA